MSSGKVELAVALADACDRMSVVVPQETNSLLILDNTRMLHGRAAIVKRINLSRHYIRVYGRKLL